MGNKLIAPMVFIPFIENAFKHTNNKKIENAITIDIFVKDDNIGLVCADKFEPGAKKQQPDSGLGNELIKSGWNSFIKEDTAYEWTKPVNFTLST